MKPLLMMVAACFLMSATALRAQTETPEDEYFNVYSLIQKAENLQARGKNAQAYTNYVRAETVLKKLQEDYPLWEPPVVKYRLNYLQSKVAATAPAAKSATPGVGQKPVSEMITPGDPTEPVAMKVKWHVGKRYLMTVEQGVKMDSGRSGPGPGKQSMSSTLNLAVNVLKERDGGGQELELEDLGAKTDGRPAAESPLAGAHIKYLADANGKIESVENFEQVRDQMVASAPSETRDALKKSISEKSIMEIVSMSEGLPDKPVKSGDSWSEKTDMGLPGSPGGVTQPLNVKYTFAGWATHAQQKCAVIEFAGEMSGSASGAQKPGASGSVPAGKVSGKLWFNPEAGMVVEEAENVVYTLQANAGKINGTTGIKVVETDIAK